MMEEYYNKKGTASHYCSQRINVLLMMEQIWGTQALMMHYEMTMFEYRYRMGKKDPELIHQDLVKTTWFEAAVEYLQEKLEAGEGVKGLGPGPQGLPEAITKKLNKGKHLHYELPDEEEG